MGNADGAASLRYLTALLDLQSYLKTPSGTLRGFPRPRTGDGIGILCGVARGGDRRARLAVWRRVAILSVKKAQLSKRDQKARHRR